MGAVWVVLSARARRYWRSWLALALLVAIGTGIALALLAVTVGRRRADAALLKSLGLVRRQVAAVVCWQAVTVAVAGIVAGAPLGIAAGRSIWRAFAGNVGVVPVPVLPGWLIVALAAGTVLVALLVAALPALAAARTRPGRVLRAELAVPLMDPERRADELR